MEKKKQEIIEIYQILGDYSKNIGFYFGYNCLKNKHLVLRTEVPIEVSVGFECNDITNFSNINTFFNYFSKNMPKFENDECEW